MRAGSFPHERPRVPEETFRPGSRHASQPDRAQRSATPETTVPNLLSLMSKAGLDQNTLNPATDPAPCHLPQVLSAVPAGFPSPADDYMDTALDLNEYLINNRASSFYVRVAGDSMTGAGIMSGDILLVDRSIEPGNNRTVVAVIDNEMVVKRLRVTRDKISLVSENPRYRPIEITGEMECFVWGVVTAVIRKLS